MAKPPADIGEWLALDFDESAIWNSLEPGPPLAELAARLSSAPRDFLDPRVSLRALAGDVFGYVDEPMHSVLITAQLTDASRRGAALALWLWASEELVGPLAPPLSATWATRAIAAVALRLSPMVDPADWLVDSRNREEAVRLFLLWCGQLPAGEDVTTAQTMWQRHDSIRRNAALAAALQEHQHRIEVTQALAAQQAAEAAARYTHE
jgi:hypothetical protein